MSVTRGLFIHLYFEIIFVMGENYIFDMLRKLTTFRHISKGTFYRKHIKFVGTLRDRLTEKGAHGIIIIIN